MLQNGLKATVCVDVLLLVCSELVCAWEWFLAVVFIGISVAWVEYSLSLCWREAVRSTIFWACERLSTVPCLGHVRGCPHLPLLKSLPLMEKSYGCCREAVRGTITIHGLRERPSTNALIWEVILKKMSHLHMSDPIVSAYCICYSYMVFLYWYE